MPSPSTVPFAKLEALGNDFLIFYARDLGWPLYEMRSGRSSDEEPKRKLDPWLVSLCQRRHGLGCDQLIVLEDRGSTADSLRGPPAVGVGFWNSDGSGASMCGNGLRAVTLFLLADEKRRGQIVRLKVGEHLLKGQVFRGKIRVEVPQAKKISSLDRGRSLKGDLLQEGPASWRGAVVSSWKTANPHLVVWKQDASSLTLEQLTEWGAVLQSWPDFPDGVNVHFVNRRRGHKAFVQVYERGAGVTPACGSGAVAIAKALGMKVATVVFPGGEVSVSSGSKSSTRWLTGPVSWVARGVLKREPLMR